MSTQAGLLATLVMFSYSLFSSAAMAQPKQVEPAPIPTQITSAKKVFIANAGGDDPGIPDPLFSGGTDRAYNQFYGAMKNAAHYELEGSPAEADLLFEIRFTVIPDKRPTGLWGGNGSADSYDAIFRVEIRDPKMNALLWAFNEHMAWAALRGNRDKNFDEACARIVTDVLALNARADGTGAQTKP